MEKINFFKLSKEGMDNLINMETYLHGTTLEPKLMELVKIRSSQINGCAYCLNMHTIDALKIGETNQRIFLLNAWDETRLFTDKEKAALELTEKLTLVATNRVSEELLNKVLKHFTKKEFADLVLLISQINVWNRINVSTSNDID